jgi:hypothetical protein
LCRDGKVADVENTQRNEREFAVSLIWDNIDSKSVDTARVLAADAVEKVGNGHPGTAISLAPVAYLLFQKVMTHDPADDLQPALLSRLRTRAR